MKHHSLEEIEIHLLLEGLHRVYGYDFRDYADASLRRRLRHWLAESPFDDFSQAQSRLLRERDAFDSLLRGITVNVTEMFRDPAFFKALRSHVVDYLKTYPFVKVWLAGCATGEEAYSMAILLHEEGLGKRSRIYATDINEAVLGQAREGIVRLADMQRFTRNYQQSGGGACFADYYTARYDRAIFAPELKENIVFAPHNLAADAEFGEMHLILCRNVLIYFKPRLKDRCLKVFGDSLAAGGFLCLGLKETLENRDAGRMFEEAVRPLRIYRKRYA